MQKSKKKKIIAFLIKVLVSLFFLFLVIFQTNWSEVCSDLKEIKIWWLFFYVLIFILGMFISSYKWKLLSVFKGINSTHWNFFKLYLIGTFINNFMPSFIAGDAYKAYAIGKKDEKYAEATSTVIMDRVTGFIGATILALFFGILNFKNVIHNKVLLIIYLILILSFLLDILIAWLRRIKPLKTLVLSIMPEKIVTFLLELYSYNGNKKVILKSIWLGIIFSFIGVGILNYILFIALEIKIGLLNYFSVIFIISIISALPISINNIGLKEWAYITLFGFFGISTSSVVTVAIISRFIQMLVSFSALPIYLKMEK